MYRLRRSIGMLPKPAEDADALARYVYGEAGRVARQYGARLVVVVLGQNVQPVSIDPALFPADAIVVNAHQALLEHLPFRNKDEYEKAYGLWRGSPLQRMDTHPNIAAHRIIAQTVAAAIKAAALRHR